MRVHFCPSCLSSGEDGSLQMCAAVTGLRSATLTPVVGVPQGAVEHLGVHVTYEAQ